MPLAAPSIKHAWWSELRHGGLLISPAVLDEYFPEEPLAPSPFAYNRLRDRYNSFAAWLLKHTDLAHGEVQSLHTWLDNVLEDFLGHDKARWLKGSNVPDELTVENALGERLRPNRVLYLDGSRTHPALVVWVDRTKHVGMGKGRTAYSRLIEFLRTSGLKLGLLTNGTQFRLCYAGLDHESWTEWDIENWFEEGELRLQLLGFLTLLGPNGLASSKDGESTLLSAVQASRTRQGELSTVLGEQVRQAVELILSEVDKAKRKYPALLDVVRMKPDGSELPQKRILEALYQATSRVVMRMVIVLYAEARGMLPRNLESYNASYGLEGLYERLRSAVAHEGFRALGEQSAGWPRILSLFRLIHDGSPHPELPVQTYSGLLFRPGNSKNDDPIMRALALMEDLRVELPDATVLEVLTRLKIGKIKIRHGRTSSWVSGPVDFTDLRTEYIGIMYEGLLDYELKATDQTMVFLNIGQQPILPLEVLENMPDARYDRPIRPLHRQRRYVIAYVVSGSLQVGVGYRIHQLGKDI